MTDTSLREQDLASLMHPFTSLHVHRQRGPMVIDRGKGIFVVDDTGKEYIEGIAGLWSTALGFGDEELIDAVTEQMRRLSAYHAGAHKATDVVIRLADKLKQLAPFDCARVFFTSSGSEANDTQLKFLWAYANLRDRPAKKVISRLKGYHGSTLASGSLTGIPSFHQGFDLPFDFVRHVSCPSYHHGRQDGETEEEFCARMAGELEHLIQAEGPETFGAFIAEPVMVAGGVLMPPEGYFARVQEVLRRYGIRFVDDEVVCGIGRTGAMWGAQTYGIEPHTVSAAKGLSSGYLPIGAVLIDAEMDEALHEHSERYGGFGHGFTYSGHPVAAAVALRVLEIVEERKLLEHVRALAPVFAARIHALRDHPLVVDTRAVGLLGAVELAPPAGAGPELAPGTLGATCLARSEHHGLICRAMGDVLGFCPPLVITEAELHEMFDRFTRALEDTWAACGGGVAGGAGSDGGNGAAAAEAAR